MLIDEPPEPVWDGMSRADFLLFAAHIRWTADQMGLRDWRLQLKWEPANVGEGNGNCWARCEVMGNIKSCNIWLFEGFSHIPRWEAHRAIVHELVHILLDALLCVGEGTLGQMMGVPFTNLMAEEMHRQVEIACETIAAHWSHTLDPIPDSLTADDNISITLRSGKEVSMGEYLA